MSEGVMERRRSGVWFDRRSSMDRIEELIGDAPLPVEPVEPPPLLVSGRFLAATRPGARGACD